MSRENGTQNRGLLAGFSPLAGVSAGTAAVLFVFGALCLAWHQVSGHVSLAITVVAYVVAFAVAAAAAAGAWLAVLWVAHRHRHPELLVRGAVRAEVVDAEPQVIAAAALPAIEAPRVYFTDAQFAKIMERQVAVTQLPRDDQDQRTA